MKSQPLSFKTRIRAVICHLASLAWLPIELMFSPLIKIINQDLAWVSLARFYLPTVAMILATSSVFFLWKVNRKIHPFVDLSGRCATNLMLSSSLYLTIGSTLLGITCGIPLYLKRAEAAILSVFWIELALLIQFCLIIAGIIFTLLGKIANYPLTIKFLSEAP